MKRFKQMAAGSNVAFCITDRGFYVVSYGIVG